ncbi:MAG: hypothetical protein JSS72_07490 [Armatimonadetes bacterium]|nr:hypothetical protein [Armatimonadota bacterium]
MPLISSVLLTRTTLAFCIGAIAIPTVLTGQSVTKKIPLPSEDKRLLKFKPGLKRPPSIAARAAFLKKKKVAFNINNLSGPQSIFLGPRQSFDSDMGAVLEGSGVALGGKAHVWSSAAGFISLTRSAGEALVIQFDAANGPQRPSVHGYIATIDFDSLGLTNRFNVSVIDSAGNLTTTAQTSGSGQMMVLVPPGTKFVGIFPTAGYFFVKQIELDPYI